MDYLKEAGNLAFLDENVSSFRELSLQSIVQ